MVYIKYFIFLFLFIFLIFIMLKKNGKKIIFYQKKDNVSNKVTKYMELYLKDLSINEILFKTDQKYNFLKKKSLLNFYQKNFLNFSINDKNNIYSHIDVINKYSKKYLKIFNFN